MASLFPDGRSRRALDESRSLRGAFMLIGPTRHHQPDRLDGRLVLRGHDRRRQGSRTHTVSRSRRHGLPDKGSTSDRTWRGAGGPLAVRATMFPGEHCCPLVREPCRRARIDPSISATFPGEHATEDGEPSEAGHRWITRGEGHPISDGNRSRSASRAGAVLGLFADAEGREDAIVDLLEIATPGQHGKFLERPVQRHDDDLLAGVAADQRDGVVDGGESALKTGLLA